MITPNGKESYRSFSYANTGDINHSNYSNFIKKIMIFDGVKLNIMLIRLFR